MGRLAAALVLLFGGAASAEDVTDWAPAEVGGALVVRGFGALADALDTTEKRFGAEPSVAKAVAALRAWAPGGLGLGARQWGDGLALDRGVALYIPAPKQVRIVVGADDAERAKKRLLEVLGGLGADVEALPTGQVRLGELTLSCGPGGQFLVCDTQAVPEKAPGPPPWLKAAPFATDALLLAYADERLLSKEDVPLKSAWFALERAGDTVRLAAAWRVVPEVAAQAAALTTTGGTAAGLRTVDARTPALFKLSFDGPKLIGMAEGVTGGAPPPVAGLVAALKAGWTGDLVASMAGSFLHPVFAFGVTGPEAGTAIVDALAASVQALGGRVKVTPPVDGVGTLAFEDDLAPGEAMRLNVRYGVCDDALVFALSPADVMRCREAGARMAAVPEALARKGSHGFVIWDVLSVFTSGLPHDVLEVDSPQVHPLVQPALTLLSVFAHRVDELGAAARVEGDEVRAELWWRLL